MKARDVSCLKLDHAALRDVREQLKNSPAGLDDILAKTVPAGVAFHHAGKQICYSIVSMTCLIFKF